VRRACWSLLIGAALVALPARSNIPPCKPDHGQPFVFTHCFVQWIVDDEIINACLYNHDAPRRKVWLKATIHPEGHVDGVHMPDEPFLGSEMERCVAARVETAVFEPWREFGDDGRPLAWASEDRRDQPVTVKLPLLRMEPRPPAP